MSAIESIYLFILSGASDIKARGGWESTKSTLVQGTVYVCATDGILDRQKLFNIRSNKQAEEVEEVDSGGGEYSGPDRTEVQNKS